jgi:hypothetical protein
MNTDEESSISVNRGCVVIFAAAGSVLFFKRQGLKPRRILIAYGTTKVVP